MKTSIIRTIAMSAVCASLLGATSLASASDWRDGDSHQRVVSHHDDTALGIGIGLGLLATALILDRPHHRRVDCDDRIIERPVVIERRRWDNDRWVEGRREEHRDDRRDDRRGHRG